MNWNGPIFPVFAHNLGGGYPRPICHLIPGNMHVAILEMDRKGFGDQLCISTEQIPSDSTHVVYAVDILLLPSRKRCFSKSSGSKGGTVILDLGDVCSRVRGRTCHWTCTGVGRRAAAVVFAFRTGGGVSGHRGEGDVGAGGGLEEEARRSVRLGVRRRIVHGGSGQRTALNSRLARASLSTETGSAAAAVLQCEREGSYVLQAGERVRRCEIARFCLQGIGVLGGGASSRGRPDWSAISDCLIPAPI